MNTFIVTLDSWVQWLKICIMFEGVTRSIEIDKSNQIVKGESELEYGFIYQDVKVYTMCNIQFNKL